MIGETRVYKNSNSPLNGRLVRVVGETMAGHQDLYKVDFLDKTGLTPGCTYSLPGAYLCPVETRQEAPKNDKDLYIYDIGGDDDNNGKLVTIQGDGFVQEKHKTVWIRFLDGTEDLIVFGSDIKKFED